MPLRLPMNEAVSQLQLSGIRRFNALARQTPGCLSLTLGEPEFDTPEAIKQAAMESLQNNDTHYPPNNGQSFLLEELSRFAERRGMQYALDEIIVTNGATEAIFSALTALLNPGDEVVIPVPAFGLYEAVVTLCRGKTVPLNTAPFSFQLDESALRACVTSRTKAIILTSPNNPTGCVYTKESLEAVAQIAQEYGIYVICDDVYRQMVYEGVCESFGVLFPHLRSQLIVVDSFSKPYAMTGWRLGWLMADREVKQQIEKVHQYAVVSVTSFTQKAAVTALQTDVTQMRETYRKRRDAVLCALRDMGMDVVTPQGAFYAFPSIQKWGMSSEEFCTRLIQEGGLALVPGSCFGSEGFVRLSYCCSQDVLSEGLARLRAFLSRL